MSYSLIHLMNAQFWRTMQRVAIKAATSATKPSINVDKQSR